MYIQTKVAVTYNSGISETKQGIVKGIIESYSWLEDFNVIGVNYRYEDNEGNVLQRAGFALQNESIDNLNEVVEKKLTETDYRKKERERAYLGFSIQMQQTFGVEEDDLEIIE